jgi:hypothetical protein
MDFHAVARLAQACAWLQDVLGLEATGIRRPGLARSCYFETELFGKHLSYSVHLDGGWAYLRVEGYDQTDGAPSTLLMVADGTEGLKVLCRLVRDLERSGVREIKLPMEIGEPGQVDNWLIVNLSLRRLASRAAFPSCAAPLLVSPRSWPFRPVRKLPHVRPAAAAIRREQ